MTDCIIDRLIDVRLTPSGKSFMHISDDNKPAMNTIDKVKWIDLVEKTRKFGCYLLCWINNVCQRLTF